jgi:hypothetical protein
MGCEFRHYGQCLYAWDCLCEKEQHKRKGSILNTLYGGVAQQEEAPGLSSGQCGFESHHPHNERNTSMSARNDIRDAAYTILWNSNVQATYEEINRLSERIADEATGVKAFRGSVEIDVYGSEAANEDPDTFRGFVKNAIEDAFERHNIECYNVDASDLGLD